MGKHTITATADTPVAIGVQGFIIFASKDFGQIGVYCIWNNNAASQTGQSDKIVKLYKRCMYGNFEVEVVDGAAKLTDSLSTDFTLIHFS